MKRYQYHNLNWKKSKKESNMKRTQITNDQKSQVPDIGNIRRNKKCPITVQQSCLSADLPSLRELLLNDIENSTNSPDVSNNSAKSNTKTKKRKLDKYKDPFVSPDYDSDHSHERPDKKSKIEMNFASDSVAEAVRRSVAISRMFSDGLEDLNSHSHGMTSIFELHKSESSLVSESYKYLANKEHRKSAESTNNRPNLADLQSVRSKKLTSFTTSTRNISTENIEQSIFNLKFECSGNGAMSNQELRIPNTNENSVFHFIKGNVDENFDRCDSSLSLFQASKYGGNISASYNLSKNISEDDVMHNHGISQLTFNSTFSAQHHNFTTISSKFWTLEGTLTPTTILSPHNNGNFEYAAEPPSSHILDWKCDENCVAQPLQNDWFRPLYIPMEQVSDDTPNLYALQTLSDLRMYSFESENNSLTSFKLETCEIIESLQEDSYPSDQNSLKQRLENLENTKQTVQESNTHPMTLLSNFSCEYQRAYASDTSISNSSCKLS